MVEYARLLVAYDRANITGAKTLSEAILDHVLDSLSCFLASGFHGHAALIDVGSGGGLPGIPLKLALPELELTLLEATGKKVEFLRQALRQLGVSEARAISARAEEAGQNKEHREKYEVATARAVAKLPVLVEYCVPLVRRGGVFVAMKGHLEEGELEAGERVAARLGGELSEVIEVPFIPEIEKKRRQLVVIKKAGQTPEHYPRRSGRPAKQPLG